MYVDFGKRPFFSIRQSVVRLIGTISKTYSSISMRRSLGLLIDWALLQRMLNKIGSVGSGPV
jgi:hypothetical protein